jgi:hypothetical protein
LQGCILHPHARAPPAPYPFSPHPATRTAPPPRQEYDAADTKLTPAQQRAALKKRLLGGSAGGVAEQLMDVDDMVDDADIAAALEPSRSFSGKQAGKQAATELLVDMAGLSARERNKLRRKTKALTRLGSGASRECSPRMVGRCCWGCWLLLGLLSGCCRAAVGLLSGCCQAASAEGRRPARSPCRRAARSGSPPRRWAARRWRTLRRTWQRCAAAA